MGNTTTAQVLHDTETQTTIPGSINTLIKGIQGQVMLALSSTGLVLPTATARALDDVFADLYARGPGMAAAVVANTPLDPEVIATGEQQEQGQTADLGTVGNVTLTPPNAQGQPLPPYISTRPAQAPAPSPKAKV